MTKISREEILKLARLARLNLSDEEVSKFQSEITDILNYVEILDNADTNNLEPTYQVTGLVNSFREDSIINYGTDKKELLKNVPKKNGEYIEVNRMIG